MMLACHGKLGTRRGDKHGVAKDKTNTHNNQQGQKKWSKQYLTRKMDHNTSALNFTVVYLTLLHPLRPA